MLNLCYEFKEKNSTAKGSVFYMSLISENYYRNAIAYISYKDIGITLIRELLCHTKCLLMGIIQRKQELQ